MKTATFEIKDRKESRYLRMRITGPGTDGRLCLEMKTFEWFGTLIEAPRK
jgi:hypothetical protein